MKYLDICRITRTRVIVFVKSGYPCGKTNVGLDTDLPPKAYLSYGPRVEKEFRIIPIKGRMEIMS
jgi:hypothetical protein